MHRTSFLTSRQCSHVKLPPRCQLLLHQLVQQVRSCITSGLNVSVHQGWRIGDPHKKKGKVDRHNYEILIANGKAVVPRPRWHSLYRWLVSQSDEFCPYDTVYVVTDNRDLVSNSVRDLLGLAHWPTVAAWWRERIQYVGPYGERTNVVFVPIAADTGLDKVHPTWAGTYILNACVYLFASTNFALIDSDCVPVTLFEIQELWHSSCYLEQPVDDGTRMEQNPSSPIAPAHKRSRSVDAGKADQPSGPPSPKVLRVSCRRETHHHQQLPHWKRRLTLGDRRVRALHLHPEK